MALITGINKVMAYTEQCLKDELDVDKIAQLCGCTYVDFQRVFSLLNDMSYLEYVRMRRLSQAAIEIIHTQKRILDIAIEYGYESGDVFAAAFRRVFGCSPSQARKDHRQLQLFLPRTFDITIHGNNNMNYKIIRKDAMKMSGYSVYSTNEENHSIKFWSEVKENGTLRRMMKVAATTISYGLCFGFDDMGSNRYMIAVEGELENCEVFELPSAEWMVFQSVGPLSKKLSVLWQSIYTVILPISGYDKNIDMPTIEMYEAGDCEAEDYRMEIWIPVIRK